MIAKGLGVGPRSYRRLTNSGQDKRKPQDKASFPGWVLVRPIRKSTRAGLGEAGKTVSMDRGSTSCWKCGSRIKARNGDLRVVPIIITVTMKQLPRSKLLLRAGCYVK